MPALLFARAEGGRVVHLSAGWPHVTKPKIWMVDPVVPAEALWAATTTGELAGEYQGWHYQRCDLTDMVSDLLVAALPSSRRTRANIQAGYDAAKASLEVSFRAAMACAIDHPPPDVVRPNDLLDAVMGDIA